MADCECEECTKATVTLCHYTCEECGAEFNEFEMNFKAAQEDKKVLCQDCRQTKADVKAISTRIQEGGDNRGKRRT